MPGPYTLGEKLHEGKARLVHRAEDTRTGEAVIVKLLRPGIAGADDLRKLRHERDMLVDIVHPSVARLLDYGEEGLGAWLAIEDIGGESVARRLAAPGRPAASGGGAGARLPLRDALAIAAGVARALVAVHARDIVHKDVGPNNVALAPDGRVQLFDFDTAARLPRSGAGLPPSGRLEGTLAYLSPEQTGRASLPLDERSDLYSLGALLHELLTGRPPFRGDDALEIVHAHLALRPAPPHEIDRAIPEVVSRIAQRLLEKAPEDRYQSAFAVERDLRACLDALDAGAPLPALRASRAALPARLHLPARVYGREREAEQLRAAFEACREARPSLVVVAGPPGVGKSTLIQALVRRVAAAGGFVGTGKIEAPQPLAPCAALIEPLAELAAQVFAAGEAEVAALSARVAQTVGAAGAQLAEIVPELRLVLGGRAQGGAPDVEPRSAPPASARALAPEGARMLFTDLFRALARPERPVTLVLDDVQWADAGSLDLIGALACDADIRGLCLVVTTRLEALEPGAPFAALLEMLERERAPSTFLSLSPLDPEAQGALLGDTLALAPEQASELGALLARKTNGNALSIRLFLATIYREGLLAFDAAAGRWTWDAAAIEALPVADNVVALLADRAGALGAGVRRALGVAACLGGRFDAGLAGAVGDIPAQEAAALLDAAAREGLIVVAEGGFRFAHDRVREAAYGAVSPEEMRAWHAAACRTLRVAVDRLEDDVRLFDVLRHAEAAGDVFDEDERLALARLGLVAGRRARASAALDAALVHLRAALARLPSSAWSRERALACDLHTLAAQCAYAAGRSQEGDALVSTLLARARSDEERARTRALRLAGIPPEARDLSGLDEIRDILALLGVHLPRRGTMPVMLLELARAKRAIAGRSVEQLAALPVLSDPRIEATLAVLQVGLLHAYYVDRAMYSVLALRGVALVARHGHSQYSAALIALYGLAVGAALHDHERMKELGQLAFTLHARYPEPVGASMVWMMNGVFFQHHRDHLRTALPILVEGQRLGLLAGSLQAAGVCAYFLGYGSFFSGRPLADARADCDAQLRLAGRIKTADPTRGLVLLRQAILALQGETSAPGSLATADFDPEHHRAVAERGTATGRLTVSFFTALVRLHFERPREALALLDEIAPAAEREWVCLDPLGQLAYLRALALAEVAAGRDLGRIDREAHLVKLRLAARKVAAWAERSPANYRHRHALVAAELAGLTGDADTALRRYEEAIQGAQHGGFLQDAAFALERAARFYLRRGLQDVAVLHLASARRTYARWGAHGKVTVLDRRFPGLAAAEHSQHSATISVDRTATDASLRDSTGTAPTLAGAGLLDAPALLKATQALSSERTVERLFARIMEIVAESAGAERAALLLVQEGGGERIELHAEVTAGSEPVVHAEPRPLEDVAALPAGIVRWVMRRAEPALLADAAVEGPFVHEPTVIARRSRSILALPLGWQGEVLGVLLLQNDLVRGAFTEARAALLATLCAQLAILVQNARYYAELERKVEERTRALREAQSRIVALEKDATEAQMAGGFAHEMRNALAGARMMLRVALGSAQLPDGGLLQQVERRLAELEAALSGERLAEVGAHARALGEVRAELEDTVKRVDEAVARGLGITNDVLAYGALRGEEPGTAAVRLRPLADEIAAELRGTGVSIDVVVPGDISLRASVEHVRTVLANVLRNACEAVAASPSGAGRVRVSAVAAPSGVTLRVEDDGPGMSQEVQARIFEPFFSTKPSAGLGLGLGVVRKLVLLYDGRLLVDSAPGRGTAIAITFPARSPARPESGHQDAAG